MQPATPVFSLLRTLTRLTLFFVAVQILYFAILTIGSGLIHILAAQAITLQFLKEPVALIPLFTYLSTQIFLYALFTTGIWYMAKAIGKLLSLQPANTYSLGVMLWIACITFILTANTLHVSQSIFAFSITSTAGKLGMTALYWLAFLCIALAMLFTLAHLGTATLRRNLRWRDKIALSVITAVCLLSVNTNHFIAKHIIASHPVSKKPNIILISIEALRPEFISQPYQDSVTMPFLSSILNESMQFTDAYTPIAQSFPSWISLLTGKTPLHHGARSLYTKYAKINFKGSLIQQLNQHGYETIYAVDGQRFGDITTHTGFSRIISPPYGIAELVIGSISDFPLSNLLISTRIGQSLFPFSFANRSISATYRPNDFIQLLSSSLRNRSDKPLFLSVHFSMSHWPYRWADDQQADHTRLSEKYKNSLRAADTQIQQFHSFLQSEKILNHAIVIFISDHGTGLGIPGDSLMDESHVVGNQQLISFLKKLPYSNSKKSGTDTSYGYSTDILSLQQYHVLLAFKGYGIALGTPQQITTRASLLDVTPTLLDLLHLPISSSTDGISLLSVMQHPHQPIHADRELFFENGFTTPDIAKESISVNEIVRSTIHGIMLDRATGLLYINDHAEKSLLKKKQRAVLYGDWLLARQSPDTMVLVNIKDGQWTTDWHSSLAKRAPLQKLLRDFQQYNGEEI